MIWQNYKLDDTISKATEHIRLWGTERGLVKIDKNTLAIAIELDEQRRGYVFHGHGKFLLDAIIETEEGAIGKSVENELNEPFLMLGDIEEIRKLFTEASEEDFVRMGYNNQKGFVARAEDLLDQVFSGEAHSSRRSCRDHGLIFAFQSEAGELNKLVVKGPKLVYKATDIVFISDRDKAVLKRQDEVVCKNKRNSVIIKNDKSIIISDNGSLQNHL